MLIKNLGVALVAGAVVANSHAVIVASDNASNYGSGWISGSNGGTGFGAWSFTQLGGGYKGNYIGNPNNIGISGMGSSTFALYANGPASGLGAPTIYATRAFDSALGIGDSFSMQWGINWDGDNGSAKGIWLYSGSGPFSNGNVALQVLNTDTAAISVNSYVSGAVQNTGFRYGTNAMTWTFTQTTATTVTVTANDRDGSGTYTGTFAVNGPLSGFGMFAQAMMDNNPNRNPYYNNFTINAVPAPGAAALVGIAGVLAGRRRRN